MAGIFACPLHRPLPLALVFLVLLSFTVVGGGQYDDCVMLQESELGNTTVVSNTGLLADALAASNQPGDAYQLLEFNTVCLGQGSVRDTYRTTSLIVRFRDNEDNEWTMQLHYQCNRGVWNITADGFGSSANAVTAAGGTLTTALRTDCFLCLDPTLASGGQTSVEEHCIGNETISTMSFNLDLDYTLFESSNLIGQLQFSK